MAISRQQIFAAIAAETVERSGPMPAWLVAVAVNAYSVADRHTVDAELIALRSAGLIDCRGNRAQGSGITLTDAGRAELDRLRRAKPVAPTSDASVPATQAATASAPAADPELVERERQPALYALLCDLAGLVGERLHDAFEDDDLEEMARLRGLGKRIQHHTGGPRS